MSPELEAALEAAHAAGRIQRRRFRRSMAAEQKADDTPVTATDRDSEAAIRRILLDALPDASFVGEETGESGHNPALRWIVDPLDGTKKFVRGLPFFGPCIALERDGELVVGVIHLPILKETAWAERGAGAFMNGESIHVSDQRPLDRSYLVCGNEAGFLKRGWGVQLERLLNRSYHNPGFLDAYSYVSVACGRVDGIAMVGEAPWDIAAAQVLVQEAGGQLTDFSGTATVASGTSVTTNGRIHDEVLALVADCR
jgi:histidinol-phosphatase